MSITPALSIVMPTRNQAGFLPAAVDSVLAQAQGAAADLELVVVDGASDDGTPALLADIASRHPQRVRWLSEPDEGPAHAVNKAVALARGAIVGWLNSDDLYAPGAAVRALQAFAERPEQVMVYGEGDHVDLDGHLLGRYPTRAPDAPLAGWADGCWICQPTAFFRREAFEALGGLDQRLRAAFDYEFWLRLFKAYPGRIGHLEALQAMSRLHEGGITLRMREQVAMEGMQVVHRHLGAAPVHWLVTHAAEALAACPFDADVEAVRRHLFELAERATPWLAPGGVEVLKHQLKEHHAWKLARPGLVADVHADGWAPPSLAIRVRQPAAAPFRRLRIWGLHDRQAGARLSLSVHGLDAIGDDWAGSSCRPGPFELSIPLPAIAGEDLRLNLVSASAFVPAETQPGSTDRRRLAFRLIAIEAV
ncbi:glycosyltransferase [Rubrivivax sp. JA1024]|nr:glycosyltransferase [Rubrivivax sp. JA1024]